MGQVRAFVEGFEPVDYKPKDRASACAIRAAHAGGVRLRPGRSRRPGLRAYIDKMCGFSPGQSHEHIPARFARECPSPFLNFHRPCLFATEARHSRASGNDDLKKTITEQGRSGIRRGRLRFRDGRFRRLRNLRRRPNPPR